jgi:translation initiation factor 2 gamma subunit (eIF-2gamma)
MTGPSKSVIIGTAGHIDHGKSSLVEALTGTNPDRLEEEKRRGITIDLGFAFLEENGVRFGFVDVPGHERFVSNMLAGAAGVDLVLLVIAADESIFAGSSACSAASWRSRKAIWSTPTLPVWCAWKLKTTCAVLSSKVRPLFP